MNTKAIRYALLGGLLSLTGIEAVAQTRELGSTGELLDGIAALVDEGVVLKSEVEERIGYVVENFRAQQAQLPAAQRGSLPPLSALERQVLDQLILEEIQVQRADRLGIVIGDDMLNQVLSEISAGIGTTLDRLPAMLAADGIDYETFRQQQRRDLLINQLERVDVIGRISITQRELDLCLERLEETQTDEFDYNVSHILIGFPLNAAPGEIDVAERRINELLDEIEAGGDFAQLALAYSESQTALQGGALGWRKGSELPTMFTDVVLAMGPGEVSEPIRTSSGFHLVRLNDVRGSEQVVVEQVRARHILIAPNEIMDDDATMQRLIGIRNQILEGDDFAAVASAVSEDTASAAEGGDLGWAEPDAYVDAFTAKLNTLEIGVLSAPFRTEFGWHIVEVLERRAYDMTEDLKAERCQREIGNSKVQEARDLWTRRIRDEAFVEYKL